MCDFYHTCVIYTKHVRVLPKLYINKGANGEESGDKETQAMILVMVVDQNGKGFAKLKS